MAERIVQKTIANLRRPKAGNQVCWDDEVAGFGVRISHTGVISFVLEYRIHGRKRRFNIGRHPELSATAARDRALKLRVRILDGHDPLEEREQDRSEPTMLELCDDYLERHALPHKRPSSVRNDRQMIDNIIRPRLGSLRVVAVSQRDIESLLTAFKATPYRANRVRSLLSKMFSLAREWKWVTGNPVRDVKKFHEDRREAWLSVEQLQRFTQALDGYPDQGTANALRLLLLTGSREMEVVKSDWSEFDLPRGVWTKPSHSTKERKIEHIPLSAGALGLLRQMNVDAGKPKSGPLFPGRKNGCSRVTIRRPWEQVCRAAGLAESYQVKGKRGMIERWRPAVRIHDLRHTFASYLVSKGQSLHIVGRLLGHVRSETTQRYSHIQDEALRDAADVFSGIFEAARSGERKQTT